MLESFTVIFILCFSVKGREKSENNTVVLKAIATRWVQTAWIGWQWAKIREYKGVVHVIDWLSKSTQWDGLGATWWWWGINTCEGCRIEQRREVELQCKPDSLPPPGRGLWSENCPSELSCMWLNWLGLCTPSLLIHWVWPAQEEAWPRLGGCWLSLKGLTTLPDSGQQVLPWKQIWAGHLCVIHSVVGKTYPNIIYHRMGKSTRD